MTKVKIEVMDQHGKWHKLKEINDVGGAVQQSLKTALKSNAMAKKSGKARAVDAKTGIMIDMLQG